MKTKEAVSKMNIVDRIVKDAKRNPKRIVFPETDDERVIEGVRKISKEGVAFPVLIGNKKKLVSKINDKKAMKKITIIEPEFSNQYFISLIKEKLGKNASIYLNDKVYYGLYLMEIGEADALISGAAHTTAHTVRAALKMIGMRRDVKRISSYFIISKEENNYLFADCAINIMPNEKELAEIAFLTCKSAEQIGIMDKRIAFISFSTKGSAQHPSLERIRKAVTLARNKIKKAKVDGELQIDAAIVPEVAIRKCPDSPIKGKANILIFPDLQSGNIAYKMAERFGRYEAIGPIIQGLNKPVNDLSRGCNAKDIFYVAAITSKQLNKE